eukprot:14497250-Ditylum_brightwellii.AAC.1
MLNNDSWDWLPLGSDINGEAAGDLSGYSVSLSGDGHSVAIGARRNMGNGKDSGHVRIYHFDDKEWVQLGSDIDGESAHDWSGQSVSISDNGSVVAIGAPFNIGNGNTAGHVRVFQFVEPLAAPPNTFVAPTARP